MCLRKRCPSLTNSCSWLIVCLVSKQSIAARIAAHTKLSSWVSAENQAQEDQCGLEEEFDMSPAGITSACTACTGQNVPCPSCMGGKVVKCKWCPLNLMCQKEGTACMARKGRTDADKEKFKKQDTKIKQGKFCRQRTGHDRTPYLNVMMENYGEGWDRPENEPKLADARRCLQWSLNWPVEEDPNMKLGRKISIDDVGLWACKSAMLREAFIGLITGGFNNLNVTWRQSSGMSAKQGAHIVNPASAHPMPSPLVSPEEDEEANASFESAMPSLLVSPEDDEDEKEDEGGFILLETHSKSSSVPVWDVQQVRPRICDFLALKGYKNECAVHAYGARDFQELRRAFAQPNGKGDDVTEALLEELMAGPIVSFNPGGGKGGGSFARTWNSKYKVKLELRRGTMGDHFVNEPQNLLYLIKGRPDFQNGSVSMQEHFRNHPDSMLNRYYGLVKLVVGGSGNYCLLMQDATHNLKDKAPAWKVDGTAMVAKSKLYDLKGMSRNQEKPSPGSTGYNPEFKAEQPDGVLGLSDHQCQSVLSSLGADLSYLDAHELIDYSFMIFIADLTDDAPEGAFCAGTAGPPYCEEAAWTCGQERCRKGYTFNIIDYLNDKNFAKSLEWKNGDWKFKDYGLGMRKYMASICQTRDP